MSDTYTQFKRVRSRVNSLFEGVDRPNNRYEARNIPIAINIKHENSENIKVSLSPNEEEKLINDLVFEGKLEVLDLDWVYFHEGSLNSIRVHENGKDNPDTFFYKVEGGSWKVV